MHSILLFAATATPTPSPAPITADAAQSIGPGFIGFVFTAAVAILTILLIRDMTRRIRRVRYAGEAEMRQAQLVERGTALRTDDELAPGPVSSRAPGEDTEPKDTEAR